MRCDHDCLVLRLPTASMPERGEPVHYALGRRDHAQRSPRGLESRNLVVVYDAIAELVGCRTGLGGGGSSVLLSLSGYIDHAAV